MKEINVEEAASWSDEEAAYNLQYLSQRSRYEEMDRINAIRGGAPAQAVEEVQAEVLAEPNVLEGMSVDDVLHWVDDDPVKAAEALAFENERPKPRKGVVEELTTLLENVEE